MEKRLLYDHAVELVLIHIDPVLKYSDEKITPHNLSMT